MYVMYFCLSLVSKGFRVMEWLDIENDQRLIILFIYLTVKNYFNSVCYVDLEFCFRTSRFLLIPNTIVDIILNVGIKAMTTVVNDFAPNSSHLRKYGFGGS